MITGPEYNVLGQILDTTFGKSSTTCSPTRSIKASLMSEGQIKLMFTTLVNFATESALRDQKNRLSESTVDLLNDYITDVKKSFKEMTGRTLKVEEASVDESVEMIYVNTLSPLRRAYYKKFVVLQVS